MKKQLFKYIRSLIIKNLSDFSERCDKTELSSRSRPPFFQPHEPNDPDRNQRQTDELSSAQPEKHQAVGSKTFDKKPADRIQNKITEQQLAVRLFEFPLDHKNENQKHAQIPNGFVKKGGMHVNPAEAGVVNGDGPGQIGLSAVGFLIEEIAPSADRLSQRQGWNEHVGQLQKRELPRPAEKCAGDQPCDDAAVDREPAVPNFDDVSRVSAVVGPLKNHVPEPGSDDDRRHHDNKKVVNVVPFDTRFI